MNSGIVKGAGAIASLTATSGSIQPGNSIGTLSITGDYNQNGAGLEIEVNSSGEIDLIDITGNASISGDLTISFLENLAYTSDQELTFLETDGSITGDFTSVTYQNESYLNGLLPQIKSMAGKRILFLNAPPQITGPSGMAGDATSTKSIAENTTAVHTFTANETVTWSLNGGADADKFSISSSGVLSFQSAPDFEKPTDTGDTAGNNTYVVVVRATDGYSSSTDQTIKVTVTDTSEVAALPRWRRVLLWWWWWFFFWWRILFFWWWWWFFPVPTTYNFN